MTFRPRRRQIEASDAVDAYTGTKGMMVVLPTGVGKTAFANWKALPHLDKGNRVMWLAHREELITQPLKSLRDNFPEYGRLGGIVRADEDDCDKQIIYCSKDTVKNPKRMERCLRMGKPSLLVVDEAHLSMSATFQRVIAEARSPHTLVLGLTATPDGDLGSFWDIVYACSLLDAMRDGVLTQPYAAEWNVPELDLAKVGGRLDYNDKELWAAQAKAHIVEHTVEAMKAKHVGHSLPFRDKTKPIEIGDRNSLVFCTTVEQAQQTADAINADGTLGEARWICGETPKRDRKRLLEQFQAGTIQHLCNPCALTTGTDLPRCSGIVLARPTKSWVLYVQAVGRGVRTFEEQDDAFILDIAAGATRLHSLVGAPVFVSGGCLDSPDGQHRWHIEDGHSEGVCAHCGDVVPCGRRGGPHRFKDGACSVCGMVQCKRSPDHHHHWVPWDDGKQACIHCGMEIPSRLGGLFGKKTVAEVQLAEGAWKRLKLPSDIPVHCALLGKLGRLFLVKKNGGYYPFWSGQAGLRRMTFGGPCSKEEAALLCNDVLRKVQRVDKKAGPRYYEHEFTEAERLARSVAIWEVK